MSKVEMGEEEQDGTAVHDPEKKMNKASSASTVPPSSSSSLREALSSTSSSSLREQHHDEEVELKWAAIERLPTWDRLHTSLPLHANAIHPLEPVDVRRLGAADRRELVHTLITDIHEDNLRLLRHQRRRMDRVGVRQPTVEVRWRNLHVDAECQVVDGKPLPTLLNSAISTFSVIHSLNLLLFSSLLYYQRFWPSNSKIFFYQFVLTVDAAKYHPSTA
uniref:Pleiotropic ABC efflux transporter N-terminal domain-containing protein n=1 Tax=Aegilops tauschii TaxID=37682 RepID=M8C479_AEGTA